MRLRALAKINLGLDILGKREDGYHEVRMIMQTIQMYDVLEMKRKKIPGISLAVNYPFIPSDERNLVYKAAKLLMDEFQVEEKPLDMKKIEAMPGITVYMVKQEDTLWDIARQFYTTVDEICAVNGITEKEVKAGQPLLLIKQVQN